jgi:uncharacterized protein (DUF885 family)
MALCLVTCLSALPLLPAGATEPGASASRALQAMFDRAWEESAQRAPEWATYRGDQRYNDRWSDASPEALAENDRRAAQRLAEARAMPREGLTPTERVSLDMFIDNQQRALAFQPYPGYRLMSLRALGGPHTQLADLLQIMPVARAEQVEQMLARLAAYPRRMDQEIANLRRAAAAGYVPSKDLLERVLAQIDGQLVADATATPWYAPFKRLGSGIPAPEREALQQRGKTAIETQVMPPMRALRALVATELMPRAAAEGSLKNAPDGTKIYDILVRQQTTTDLPALEIHAIGLRELARLRAEMEGVMRETKFDGDFPAFVKFLNTDPRFFHTSAEALLAGYRDIAKRLDAEMPKLFAELPRAPYGVQAMPAHMGNRAEYYNGPALDGSRGGTFFANVTALSGRPKWAMETLVAHEAVPGHHLQIARATELRGLPAFRRSGFGYTAFSEGWALYAETLGFDLGLYTDPYQRYGHLQWQAFRAARLVVDTGIHALGWTRPQSIDFMVERTGVNREFVTSEVDRYTSNPGQALAYMIGQLKIAELRDRARAKLGARFDIRQFHNAVLDQGALPLATLERVIDEWIAAQLKA